MPLEFDAAAADSCPLVAGAEPGLGPRDQCRGRSPHAIVVR